MICKYSFCVDYEHLNINFLSPPIFEIHEFTLDCEMRKGTLSVALLLYKFPHAMFMFRTCPLLFSFVTTYITDYRHRITC
jgi:hypothetical protein